ncbi:MAG: hypothetical protein KAR20_24095 [Candidatus Heimdallarchaeota archaeon]|nr:hypothetical protein [Candidatus Heimdallarchaeota archaeon]
MENHETSQQKDSTSLMLFGIIILLGIIACVALIFTFTTDDNEDEETNKIIVKDYQMQADEAVSILEILKNAMLDPEKINNTDIKFAFESISDGDSIDNFSYKFGVLTGSYGQLHYYNNSNFVYHKGGKKPANGLEFYIEAKSTLKHRADTQENIDTNLVIRLYSDGTIEKIE